MSCALAKDEVWPLSKIVEDHILNDSFVVQYALESIPMPVRQKLTQVFGAKNFMADSGKPYQEGCVVLSPMLPMRRLIFSASNAKYCLVFYEQGGKALRLHVVVFGLSGPKANLLWAGLVTPDFNRPIKTLQELRDQIKEHKVIDSSSM